MNVYDAEQGALGIRRPSACSSTRTSTRAKCIPRRSILRTCITCRRPGFAPLRFTRTSTPGSCSRISTANWRSIIPAAPDNTTGQKTSCHWIKGQEVFNEAKPLTRSQSDNIQQRGVSRCGAPARVDARRGGRAARRLTAKSSMKPRSECLIDPPGYKPVDSTPSSKDTSGWNSYSSSREGGAKKQATFISCAPELRTI